MAVTSIGHKPELTKEQVREAFRAHFAGRYQIEDAPRVVAGGRDFVVYKNPFVGVGVKLEQAASETKFVYGGMAPRVWARIVFGGLASLLLWNGLTGEVRQFIETSPEFR